MIKFFNNSAKFIGVMSFFALSLAYLAEIFTKLNPCILCVYQRIPYFLLCLLAFFALILPAKDRIFKILISIILLIEIFLAFYHVGVERYIFEESRVCQFNNIATNSIVTTKIAGSCSEVHFRFMNLSMAEWNLLYSIAMLTYFIHIERKNGLFTRRFR